MRFVAIETGQAMSALQTPTTTTHHFLKTISPQYPSFYVAARVDSMVPIDAFPTSFSSSIHKCSAFPTVSHRVSVLLIRIIEHLTFDMNRQLRPFHSDFRLEDGCSAFSYRCTQFHHGLDENSASEAAGTSSMDDTRLSNPTRSGLKQFTSAMQRSISSLI